MTDVQAAIGLGQLAHLDSMLQHRAQIIARYHQTLVGAGLVASDPCATVQGSAPWLYTFSLPPHIDRDRLAFDLLRCHGIETRPVFVPMHDLPMYRASSDVLKVSTAIGKSGLSLPTHGDMGLDVVDEVASAVILNAGKQ